MRQELISRTGDLPASIFCEGGIVVICCAGFGVEDDVFEDGAEADRVEDVGLFFSGEVDAFGVTLGSCQLVDGYYEIGPRFLLRLQY